MTHINDSTQTPSDQPSSAQEHSPSAATSWDTYDFSKMEIILVDPERHEMTVATQGTLDQ